MSRYAVIKCDVCGKRGTERISDWFEIDAGPEGFFAVHLSDRPAGIGRSARDICGSRCLCVALERWTDGHLRQLREAAAGPEEEVQEWSVPLAAPTSRPLLTGSSHSAASKAQRNALVKETRSEEKTRRRGGMFRRVLTRQA